MKSIARSALISTALLALPTMLASAQTPAQAQAAGLTPAEFTGTSFAQVFQGREAWITMSNGTRTKAVLGRVAPAGLIVTANGQSYTLRLGEISRIDKVTHRLRNHTIAGLTIGCGLGLFGIAACDGEAGCAFGFIAAYGGMGVGIGALNGAVRNSMNRDDDLIYLAGARDAPVAVTPIMSRARQGVALTLSWR
jgi:hypothetical protein